LRQVERDTPQTETTPDQKIESNEKADKFLDDLIANAGELSPEEEATLRREVQAGVQKALSGISNRGLGRSSEALGVITQGAIAEETAVGAAKRDVREKGQQLQLRAAEIMTNRTEADRNYDLAVKSGNLDSLKNAQNQTLLQRAQQLDWSKFEESKNQLEREFGLALDDAELRKFIATGELDLKAIDLDQTNQLRRTQMANEFLLGVREQDINEKLGLAKLDMEKWMKGEDIDMAKVEVATRKFLTMFGLEHETQMVLAQLQGAKEQGKWDTWSQIGQTILLGAMLL
jgi:transposase